MLRTAIVGPRPLTEVYWTQLRRWFVLEQHLFFGHITSGIIFLALSYVCKKRSFWNASKPQYRVLKDKIVKDVWRQRESEDFLLYLKFEYM